VFFQQPHPFHHHAPVNRLAHVVDGEQPHLHGSQGFHFHAGFVGNAAGGKDVERAGGVIHFDRASQEKSALLYAYLDRSDYYSNTIAPQYRSRTNIVFRTRSAELDTRFWQEAEKNGLSGLKGHKIVGGLRASLYNALDISSVHALIDYMDAFAAENP